MNANDDDPTAPLEVNGDERLKDLQQCSQALIRAAVDHTTGIIQGALKVLAETPELEGKTRPPLVWQVSLSSTVMVSTAASLLATAHATLTDAMPKLPQKQRDSFERTCVGGFVNALERAATGKCDKHMGLLYGRMLLKELHEKSGRALARLEKQSASN